MITKGFILVEGLKIKDLLRAYNRDRDRINNRACKLAKSRGRALKQGLIKKEGFDTLFSKIKSEKGDWEYNLVVKIAPETLKYYYCSFTIIDDPIRPKKREIIIWEMESKDISGNIAKTPVIYKQHALERYYKRARGEEFPGILEATREIIKNELLAYDISDTSWTPGMTMGSNVSLAVPSGLFLAYKKEEEELLDRDVPLIMNTFIGKKEIEQGDREYQVKNKQLFEEGLREKS